MADGALDYRELQDALEDVVHGRANDASALADIAYRLRQALPRLLAVLDFKVWPVIKSAPCHCCRMSVRHSQIIFEN